MGNPVVHFEINGTDMAKLSSFYGSLFGWKTNAMPEMSYTLVDTDANGAGITGGIGQVERPSVTVYTEVPNAQEALDRAIALGATLVMPVMSIPGGVTLAQFADPEGNVVGLVEPRPAM